MKIPKLNWPIWVAFLLSLFAFISYPSIFARWAATRDFPWVNLLLFALALFLLVLGVRRALAGNLPHPKRSKAASGILAGLSLGILALFIFSTFIYARWLPASRGAPQVGQRAPEFSLADINGNSVSLSQLLSTPIQGKQPKGVLLVFYRGYW